MIPFFAKVGVRTSSGRWLYLWLPLFIIWVVLLPFAILMLPLVAIACRVQGLKVFRTMGAAWQCCSALRGMNIELNHQDEGFLIYIR